jgi:hypothetical protein
LAVDTSGWRLDRQRQQGLSGRFVHSELGQFRERPHDPYLT